MIKIFRRLKPLGFLPQQQRQQAVIARALPLADRLKFLISNDVKFLSVESIFRSLILCRTKILKYYFGKLFYDSYHRPINNPGSFLLSSSLNDALEYHNPTTGGMGSHRERERSRSPVERVDDLDEKTIEENKTISPDVEMLDEHGSLNDLKVTYEKALRESANIWLDFANKSCHIYLYRGGGKPSESMAAFDLDGTLIKPKSNKRIPKSATDWDLFSVWTKVKLQQAIRENNARFVIFTNQYGVGMNIVPLEEVQERIELVLKRLDIPCTVFVAIEKDGFRKPRTGMFQLFNKSFNDSLKLNFDSSFYCGDAVGYPSHSDADIKFAQTLGLPFLPPEKFLRGVKPKIVCASN